MEINIKLDKDFERQFNRLVEKYGEDFLKLNGLDESKLSFTNFIDNFVDSDNVANASVDPNANVGHKDIVSLINEMSKPHQKIIAYNKLYYELKKKYGYKTANDWLEAEWSKALYLHDAHTSTFYSYCVLPQECCSFVLDGKHIDASLEDIYSLVQEPEEYDREKNIYYKRPYNLMVQDFDKESRISKYTRVWAISKKQSEDDFIFTKLYNGSNVITTSDHRFICSDGEVPASNLEENETECFAAFDDIFTNSIYIYKGLELNEDFGYLLGFYMAEGYEQGGQMSICQSKEKSPLQWQKICSILDKYSIPYKFYKDNTIIRMTNGDNNWERKLHKLFKGRYCNEKRLCEDFVHFNETFLKAFLAGIIDGDGTISQGRQCMIRMTSRTLINQIRTIGLHFGVYFGSRYPYIQSQNAKIKQTKPMYSANVNMNRNREFFESLPSIKIQTQYNCFEYDQKMTNKNYVCEMGVVKVRDCDITYKPSKIVYDLSTTSHTFVCNNILIHNCFAYDLKDLAEKGLYFIDGFNAEPPQHLESFIDMVKEHCSYACNRSAGAVAYPNLIPYMWYFWNKDCKNSYYLKDPDTYAKQQIQRLIYSLNQPYLRGGIQSSFTNVNFFDHPYFEAIFGGAEFPDGSFMVDAEEEIIEFQKLFLKMMCDIRHKNMMTYPVSTISLLTTKDGDFVDEEFARYACEQNREWNDSNWFVDSNVTSLSSCCRLKNDVRELGYFNSIGGAALKVGSIKVSTINLARLSYKYDNEKDYLKALKKMALLNLKLLDCQRNIIKRNVEKGLLPNFDHDLIDFEHSYSSIGVMGIYETMATYGYTDVDALGNVIYKDEAYSFGKKIFETIHNVKNAFIADKDYKVNLEAIPGETAAVKFTKADTMLYPEKANKDLPLLANQWIGLGIKTSVQERVKIAAAFSEYCSGGDILHINIDAPFDSFEKAWAMLKYVAKQGVKYFAFTGKISACEHNHAFYGDVCPECGCPKETEYSRIVGFYTPVKSYTKERKKEWEMRDWMNLN